MADKKPVLDAETDDLVRRVLALEPKPHEQMKVGRAANAKKRGPKARAASAKPRNA